MVMAKKKKKKRAEGAENRTKSRKIGPGRSTLKSKDFNKRDKENERSIKRKVSRIEGYKFPH